MRKCSLFEANNNTRRTIFYISIIQFEPDAIIFRAAVIIRFLPATRKQLSNLKGNWNRAPAPISSQIKNASERNAQRRGNSMRINYCWSWQIDRHTGTRRSLSLITILDLDRGVGDFLKNARWIRYRTISCHC